MGESPGSLPNSPSTPTPDQDWGRLGKQTHDINLAGDKGEVLRDILGVWLSFAQDPPSKPTGRQEIDADFLSQDPERLRVQ